MSNLILTEEQLNRVESVLIGCAIGDALGAGYEFNPPVSSETNIEMKGGGPFNFEPGEWTDDTAMAVIAGSAITKTQGSAAERDCLSTETLDEIVKGWIKWAGRAKDVGAQTSNVLETTRSLSNFLKTESISETAFRSSHDFTIANPKSAGNGSLMRTAPIALAFLGEPEQLWIESKRVSNLTHFDKTASEACQIWTAAIRHAVLTGELDVRIGFDKLSESSREYWSKVIDTAESSRPEDVKHNGWVVGALQGAWSAIHLALNETSSHPEFFEKSVEYAVRGGYDTDTVAAIAGSLAGAAVSRNDLREDWRSSLFGYGANREHGLIILARDLVS